LVATVFLMLFVVLRASKHNHADESAAAVSEDKDDHTATGDQQHNEGDGHETAELGATVQTEVNHEVS
jgi:hypothetical protein